MRLAEELEALLDEGPQSARFQIELSSAIRELNQDWGRNPGTIRAEVEETGIDHPMITFLIGLSIWIEDRDYPAGAEPALDDLRESIDLATKEDWDHLFPIFVVQRINLLSDVNHRSELTAEVRLGICFLREKEESIPVGPVYDILDAISENLDSISGTNSIQELTNYIEEHAEKALRGEDYRNHRDLLRRSLAIRESEGRDTESVIEEIVNSYNEEIEALKSDKEHSLRATAAREALNECIEWIDENQRVEWEREFIEGNKLSIEQMAKIEHEPSEEEIEELDDEVEEYINGFREQREQRNPLFAIKWLLNHNIFIPDVELAREESIGGLISILSRRTVSQAGESYSQDESRDEFPPNYGIMVQFTQNIRQTVYYRLQNRGLIKEGDFFILFNRRDSITADSHAYLTDFIIHLFEHDHAAAVHLGMPQLEAVIRALSAKNGKSVLSRDEETGELQRKSMGSLLYEVEGEVDESWVKYLQYRYTDLSGQNVRNQIAHGYFPYKHTKWGMSIILLFDILQCFLEFEEAYSE